MHFILLLFSLLEFTTPVSLNDLYLPEAGASLPPARPNSPLFNRTTLIRYNFYAKEIEGKEWQNSVIGGILNRHLCLAYGEKHLSSNVRKRADHSS